MSAAYLKAPFAAAPHGYHNQVALAACRGKRPFPSPQLANEVARRRASAGLASTVYRCSRCGAWHLGPPSEKLKRFRAENRT